MANFWWGSDGQSNKIYWFSWNIMGNTKSNGSMGFRNLKNFNLAIFAKQLLKLITKPHSLVFLVLKEKFFKHRNALETKIRCDLSFM